MRRPLTTLIPLVALAIALLSPAGPAAAQEHGKPAEGKMADAPPPEDDLSVTRHQIALGDRELAYTATAGTLVVKDDDGKAKASVFHVAYTLDGVEDPAGRPVVFSYNGGPGAAAVWVHMGAFGPKKVAADDEGFPLSPPGRLVDNSYSLLDVADLVFIDPVSTGFSRPAPGEDAKQFHGVEQDIEWVGEFIRLWITRNERWASPKFLAGESYGTTRSAGLALHLQEELGMYLNGVILISTVLNWQDLVPQPGNDMPYIIFLPTYTATAHYHGKLPPELSGDLEAALEEAEAFALGDYASALLQGNWLPAEERRTIARELARLTGLSPDYVEQANLRVASYRYFKELLRDEGKTVGRLDTRFIGYDPDAAGEVTDYDPANKAVDVGYVALINDYIRRELGFETDIVFRALAEVWPWDFEGQGFGYVNVADDLRDAMLHNPGLKVLFTSGYYDGATPYFDSEFTIAHLGLPEHLEDNVEITYYEAGHMMYIRRADHAKFKDDVADFIRRATAEHLAGAE